MGEIKGIQSQTKNRFLNMYALEAVNKKGDTHTYFLASRAEETDELKIVTKENAPDGVLIFSVLKGKTREEDRVVLVKQYRCAIDTYIYEFPAGLVEKGEAYKKAAIREMKEETGLDFYPIDVDPRYEKPYFTTIGMTDESCAAVYGYVEGQISDRFLEDNEEIEVVLADRKEAERILKEENVAIMCAYQLMHFIHDEDVFAFLK